MEPGARTRAEAIAAGLMALGVALLALLLLANSMARPPAHDEQMYCTGGVLTAAGKVVYRDFSYIAQPPYHAALLAAFYKLSGTNHYLLVGRLISVACDILVVVFIVLIYRSVFGKSRVAGSLLGLAAAALCVFNPVLNYTAGPAWNHDPVMACVMASLWLFIRMPEERSPNRYLVIGIIVVLLTFATCMRITAALAELVFFVAIVAGLGGPVRRRLRATAVFAGIALVTAAWFVWVLLQAPHAVLLNLVRMPFLCGQWLHQLGMALDKVALTQLALAKPAYFVLLVLVGASVVVILRRWPGLDGRTKGHFILMTALAAVFVLTAFIPPTMWLQYWGVPVPFLSTMMAYPLAEVVKSRMKRMGVVAVACGVVCAVVSNSTLIGKAAILLTPEQWSPVRFHEVAGKIATGTNGSKRVLTLGPLYALEAGEGIYIELSCADFSYRVADELSPEERRITHTVGPAGLNALAVDQPPDAVLVGIAVSIPKLETPLRAVIPPSWPGVDCGNNLRLYVRP
jgi:4-amino-4-deoxy-L-arabinose transferase-like glycosyltransferase